MKAPSLVPQDFQRPGPERRAAAGLGEFQVPGRKGPAGLRRHDGKKTLPQAWELPVMAWSGFLATPVLGQAVEIEELEGLEERNREEPG